MMIYSKNIRDAKQRKYTDYLIKNIKKSFCKESYQNIQFFIWKNKVPHTDIIE